MSQIELREVTALLMLIPLGIVLGMGIFFFYCTARRSRMERLVENARNRRFDSSGHPLIGGFHAPLFGRPIRWLAVRSENPAFIQEALHLHHPMSCSWEEGLIEAREDKLFISPPMSGWILVVGAGLPDPSDDVDKFFHFISGLSRKLGHVQYFNANRVVNHHAWVLTEDGEIFRAYAWGETVLWNQGVITAAEKDLRLQCFDYGSDLNFFTTRDIMAANCEKVGQLAARWSIDPNAIAQENWDANGIVGEMS